MRRWLVGVVVVMSLACGGLPSNGMAPSPRAMATASALGIPPVTPGSGVVGPFEGPEGSLAWMSADGKVSFLLPEVPVVWMARSDTGQFVYGLAPQGFFVVKGDQVTQVADPPPEMATWPHAEPLAGLMITVLQRQIAAGGAPPTGGGGTMDPATYAVMSQISASMHETNMRIIDNIGGVGCTEYYEDGVFVGCW
ncbi:MAG: hypothetical protein H6735_25115 [Alphaproteobacteria bacterium]|nr:hypothetical protein [Alphaproteobacteria bacterium]